MPRDQPGHRRGSDLCPQGLRCRMLSTRWGWGMRVSELPQREAALLYPAGQRAAPDLLTDRDAEAAGAGGGDEFLAPGHQLGTKEHRRWEGKCRGCSVPQ